MAHFGPVTHSCLGPDGQGVFTVCPKEETIKMWKEGGGGTGERIWWVHYTMILLVGLTSLYFFLYLIASTKAGLILIEPRRQVDMSRMFRGS
jgi:hypothetical protein